jgi:hypothetical protein
VCVPVVPATLSRARKAFMIGDCAARCERARKATSSRISTSRPWKLSNSRTSASCTWISVLVEWVEIVKSGCCRSLGMKWIWCWWIVQCWWSTLISMPKIYGKHSPSLPSHPIPPRPTRTQDMKIGQSQLCPCQNAGSHSALRISNAE